MNKHRSLVREAFLSIHAGRSTDDVVIDPELNGHFLNYCLERDPTIECRKANWLLLNLRKSSSLGKVTSTTTRLSHESYAHAAQIAARLMEDLHHTTIDRVLCDPDLRAQFDSIAQKIAPTVSGFNIRKAALGLRKAKRLSPELIKRIADWGREVCEFTAEELAENPQIIPRNPGIYIFRDSTGYLYIGEAGDLRSRISKHLDHSDRRNLAQYFWSEGLSSVSVEIHSFDVTSDARKTSARRAYESDLIAKRSPRFNIRQ